MFLRAVITSSVLLLVAGTTQALAQPATCFGWHAIGQPFPRTQAALAYDSVRQVTIMTGGRLGTMGLSNVTRPLRETWVFDGERWTGIASEGPSAVLGGMCFDSARGVALHFGGIARSDDLVVQDTFATTDALWSWEGSRWSRIAASGVWPEARSEHAFAFDPVRGKAVLFGGRSAVGTRLTDLWEFDGTSWTQIPEQTVWPRGLVTAVSMAFEPSARWMVVASSSSGSTAGTWTWDGTGWNQVTVNAPIIGFGNISLTYSAARSRMIAVARGATLVTRDFSGLDWSATPASSPRVNNVSLGQDPRTGEPLIVGLPTTTSTTRQNVFTLRTTQTGHTWMPEEPPIGPGERDYAAAAHIPALQGVVLAGGVRKDNVIDESSWLLQGETWRPHAVNGAPGSPGFRAGMAWDPTREQLVLNAGSGTRVWSLVSRSWSRPALTLQPGGTSTPLAFDQTPGAIRGFTSTLTPLLWTGQNWIATGTAPVPPPTDTNLQATAIDATGRLIMAGGSTRGTFAFQDNSWTSLTSMLQPGTWGAPLAYFPALGGIVTFSGFTDSLPNQPSLGMAELTKLLPSDSNSWELVNIAGPQGRRRSAMAYDATAQRVVMHGGVVTGTQDNNINETWMLSQGPASIAVQPTPLSARAGDVAQLSIVAAGGGIKSYVWRKDGVPIERQENLQGVFSDTLVFNTITPADAGVYNVTVSNPRGSEQSVSIHVDVLPACDTIDFNRNGLSPEDQDLLDFLSVLGGGTCSNAPDCNDLDFDNDGLTPSDEDLLIYLRVLAGGDC